MEKISTVHDMGLHFTVLHLHHLGGSVVVCRQELEVLGIGRHGHGPLAVRPVDAFIRI